MSEREKRLRDEYQKNRKKLISIQLAALGVLIAITLLALIPYLIMNKNTYVSYIEDGRTDTKVFLADNSFYDEKYLDSDHAYVAELIKSIEAEFGYGLAMENKVDYKYSYKIDATVNVIDRDSKAPLYDPNFVIKDVKEKETKDNELYISEKVSIDYAKYNKIAEDFVNEYDIKDSTANLVVNFDVRIIGECDDLAECKNNSYSMNVTIPLMRQTLKMTTHSSVPSGEQKILACDNAFKSVLYVLFVIFAILSGILGIFVICFIYLTRDKHLDYSRKVQKLLSGYKSYIHRVANTLDFTGYNVLNVLTFEELLEIGDKLGSPVLMYENEDKTRSEFFIATDSNLVYLYAIEVNDDNDAETRVKINKAFRRALTLLTSGGSVLFAPGNSVSDD